ncbi:KpsF/GutQ family sugar-phosphate isomerase [Chlamydia trachomatis]|jgi:KpsF/GutQ family protein|uniref:Uncharacterized protein TC_0679 n=2 Tax=Chlamydia muridarum TaxID=83560 RepID=Y679_CHLMU|nr:KpsF/GutQ family sugar-phosphate isomerase [Chlamydia muridarum]Q9PJZ7.1 RecName: Full=Uncharacterized protein TC_0679 [Chlamydia muridarum str. Nigg]UFT35833.1 KpsF/GutQ family sugar-phosphate isomerase [Chlamydia trachomatis]AAF39499.1 carbohydrate isomerase, KpsF/GutQ family [Chlamydia muridarum str. Nigg]AHH23065.1 hypothetical protein TAC_03570 [Chlamydia muridarum str. Nigg3 CMUT3-5]AHH23990.1 hypothetical protein Y015_03570 [Chlamydia muridarum str. Nigg CM972]AID38197.1 hypothetica
MYVPDVAEDLCLDIFHKQKQVISRYFANFHCDVVRQLTERLLCHQGAVFFSGIGKSGCIARKLVATMQSFGEKAFFLSGDLLHGDLGVVSSGDIVCLFSNSGETREILEWIPHLKNRQVFLVGITSSPCSSLAVFSDFVVMLPKLEELDPFNLIPTTSTTCQLLFSDLLAMTVLRCRKISLSDYGKNHPSGQIGLKANGKVRDYLSPRTEVPFCSPSITVSEALTVLSSYGYGCVCVVNEQFELLGIFTDGDLRRGLSECGGAILECPLEQVMTRKPKVISEDSDVLLGLEMMESGNPVTVLPVVDAQHQRFIVGLLHMHTLARAGLL